MTKNLKLGTGGSDRLYKDVRGAPYKIGQSVRVQLLCDETGDPSFLGMRGLVEHFDYACGCGQSYPGDPMIGVRFPDGRIEEFWRKELKVLRHPQFGWRRRVFSGRST